MDESFSELLVRLVFRSGGDLTALILDLRATRVIDEGILKDTLSDPVAGAGAPSRAYMSFATPLNNPFSC